MRKIKVVVVSSKLNNSEKAFMYGFVETDIRKLVRGLELKLSKEGFKPVGRAEYDVESAVFSILTNEYSNLKILYSPYAHNVDVRFVENQCRRGKYLKDYFVFVREPKKGIPTNYRAKKVRLLDLIFDSLHND